MCVRRASLDTAPSDVALEHELVVLARSHLAGFKIPREVIVVDALPRNATGKVLKQQLRDTFAERPVE